MNDTYHFLSSDKFYGILIKEVDMLIGSYIRVAINIWFFIDDLSIIDHKNRMLVCFHTIIIALVILKINPNARKMTYKRVLI